MLSGTGCFSWPRVCFFLNISCIFCSCSSAALSLSVICFAWGCWEMGDGSEDWWLGRPSQIREERGSSTPAPKPAPSRPRVDGKTTPKPAAPQRYCGWLRIPFAPRNETMVETITFAGICREIIHSRVSSVLQDFVHPPQWTVSQQLQLPQPRFLNPHPDRLGTFF